MRRRRTGNPTTSERSADYDDEQREFMVAIDRYKRERRRPYPGWDEVLAVAKSIGYRLIAAAEPLPAFTRQPTGSSPKKWKG